MRDPTIAHGTTSKILAIMLRDVTAGQYGKAGLLSSDVTAYYVPECGTAVQIPLKAGTVGDAYDGNDPGGAKFAEVHATGARGEYHLHLPDAMLAVDTDEVTLRITGDDIMDFRMSIPLIGRAGKPAAANASNQVAATIDWAADVSNPPTISSFDPESDQVIVATNNDKTGYSLASGALSTLETALDNLQKLVSADRSIDKNQTPWELVLKEAGQATELLRKALFDVDGNPVTSTSTVIGQEVQP